MISIEEDRTCPEMQYLWRSTNSTDKEVITNTTSGKFTKGDWT